MTQQTGHYWQHMADEAFPKGESAPETASAVRMVEAPQEVVEPEKQRIRTFSLPLKGLPSLLSTGHHEYSANGLPIGAEIRGAAIGANFRLLLFVYHHSFEPSAEPYPMEDIKFDIQ